MVFYRKYRPQSFDELVGQTAVKQTLLSALANNKLAHAYLFCGPRGTGKTSTARILAKMVNCEKSSAISYQLSDSLKDDKSLPCNFCPTCISITDGSNLDLIEMDAASNRGIEDIRSLRETIKLAPTAAKKKIYIIDEVHMLTGEAFNALLKTLEEPPSHVLFILATTDPQKIPQTIMSRVQRLDFKLASTQEQKETLEKIAKKEKIEVDEEALVAIARRAQGSFRDGQKLLDQLAGFGKIDLKSVEENLGVGNVEELTKLLSAVVNNDSKSAISVLFDALNKGAAVKEITLGILDVLRYVLLVKNGFTELVKTEAKEDFKEIEKLAQGYEMKKLVECINNFQDSLEQLRFVSIPSLPLELAITKSCMNQTSAVSSPRPPTAWPRVEAGRQSLDLPVDSSVESSKEEVLVQEVMTDTMIPQAVTSASISPDIQKIAERWVYVLETVRQYNYSLEALLRSAKIVECSDRFVVIEVPYSFHQRILEAPKSRDLIESIFSDILGRSIKVSTALGQRPMRTEDLANVEVAPDDELIRVAAEIFTSESSN